jgi:hypothetical protein
VGEIKAWFAGQLAEGWFVEAPDITVDDDEVLVVGKLPEVELPADASPEAAGTAATARIERFREDTRDQRIRVAEGAQSRFRRKVSWGATVGDTTILFTTASVPVMTRLRIRERQLLDTLIDSGVARSRSDALAWCVNLVARNEAQWISELRAAFERVEEVRRQGPSSTRDVRDI